MSEEILNSCPNCGANLISFSVKANWDKEPHIEYMCTSSKCDYATFYIFDQLAFKRYSVMNEEYINKMLTLNSNRLLRIGQERLKIPGIKYQFETKQIEPNLTVTTKNPINVITEPLKEVMNESQLNQVTKLVEQSTHKIKIDWSRVIGYEYIKKLLDAVVNNQNKKKTHVLIAGAPGTSKTVFLKTMFDSLKSQGFNVHYLDSTTLTSSGVIQYLFNNDVEYCLLDELDKLEKEHQKTFLNLLESGILQETKGKKGGIRQKNLSNIIVIATANYIQNLLKPLLTRFLPLNIKAYTKEQFYDIGIKLLMQQYGKTEEIAKYIVNEIWVLYTEKRNRQPNLRQCVQVATLTGNDKKEIEPILKGLAEYSEEYTD